MNTRAKQSILKKADQLSYATSKPIGQTKVAAVLDSRIKAEGSVSWVKLLSSLQALSLVHRVGHWTSKGPESYSDHLLFERLYNSVEEEVDKVAEKALGMGLDPIGILPLTLSRTTSAFLRLDDVGQIGVVEAMNAELTFLSVLREVLGEVAALDEVSWKGVDNLLAGIMDKHEEHVYLLQQRML